MRCQNRNTDGTDQLGGFAMKHPVCLCLVLMYAAMSMPMLSVCVMTFAASVNGSGMGRSICQGGRLSLNPSSNALTRQPARSVQVDGSRRPHQIGDLSALASETNTASYATSLLNWSRAYRSMAASSTEQCSTGRRQLRHMKRSYGASTVPQVSRWKRGGCFTHSIAARTALTTPRKAGSRWGRYRIRAKRVNADRCVPVAGKEESRIASRMPKRSRPDDRQPSKSFGEIEGFRGTRGKSE